MTRGVGDDESVAGKPEAASCDDDDAFVDVVVVDDYIEKKN